MKSDFEQCLRAFLERWKCDKKFEDIDFSAISDIGSWRYQLMADPEEESFKPYGFCAVLGLLFLWYENRDILDNLDFAAHTALIWEGGANWKIAEPFEEEVYIEKSWAEDMCPYIMGNPVPLSKKELSEEALEIAIAEHIKFYQPALQDSPVNISRLKARLKNSGLQFNLELLEQGEYEIALYEILCRYYRRQSDRRQSDTEVSDQAAEEVDIYKFICFTYKLQFDKGLLSRKEYKAKVAAIEKARLLHKKADIESLIRDKYKAEVYKIIYFFYDLEYNRIPHFLNFFKIGKSKDGRKYFDLIEFLSKPSMESIDFSFEGWETYNGWITRFIKYPLEKELGEQRVNTILDNLDTIQRHWLNYIFQARYAVDQDIPLDFSAMAQKVDSLLSEPFPRLSEPDSSPMSPIEALYLKISQFERIGELQGFLRVNQHELPTEYHVPEEFIGRMKEWKCENILLSHVEQLVEKSEREVAKYVYLKEKPTSEERKRMRRNLWKVPLLLEFCIRANPNVAVNGQVTKLRVISCLQAILTDEEDDFKDIFYLMEKYFAHPQTDALKKGKHITEVIKLYWVRKVNNHFIANLGEYEIRHELEEYESKIYEILCRILSCSSIRWMEDVSKTFNFKLFLPRENSSAFF